MAMGHGLVRQVGSRRLRQFLFIGHVLEWSGGCISIVPVQRLKAWYTELAYSIHRDRSESVDTAALNHLPIHLLQGIGAGTGKEPTLELERREKIKRI
ncbi:hypothetical protein L6164_018686 [Bauhinia variegata]|uniref:Uncharacterized protein n=1 Tax=Bauhinia variegata TaxID=167791 RepID=A0ACB9NC26_BAUVA|nr:hypothetical protein L6164_018686 [Bauhinia variegata]